MEEELLLALDDAATEATAADEAEEAAEAAGAAAAAVLLAAGAASDEMDGAEMEVASVEVAALVDAPALLLSDAPVAAVADEAFSSFWKIPSPLRNFCSSNLDGLTMASGLRGAGVVLISVSDRSRATGRAPSADAAATMGEDESDAAADSGCVMEDATSTPDACGAARGAGSGFLRSDRSTGLPVTSSRIASGLRSTAGGGCCGRGANGCAPAPGPALRPPPLI